MIEKFAAILLLFQSHPASAPLPKFEDFRVNEIFKGTPANPLLETRFARLYRTNIRNAAKEGPNFAGHCTIAEWGCGSNCGQMAVIDEKTGHVFEGPAETIAYPPMFDYPDEGDGPAASFKLESKLPAAGRIITNGQARALSCFACFRVTLAARSAISASA